MNIWDNDILESVEDTIEDTVENVVESVEEAVEEVAESVGEEVVGAPLDLNQLQEEIQEEVKDMKKPLLKGKRTILMNGAVTIAGAVLATPEVAALVGPSWMGIALAVVGVLNQFLRFGTDTKVGSST